MDEQRTRLEAMRAKLEELRASNRLALEKLAEEREAAELEELVRFEEARARALADPKLGGRFIEIEITGVGHVITRYPSPIEWNRFQDKGLMKANGLTTALCDELVTHSVYYPDVPALREIMRVNPTASLTIVNAVVAAMAPAVEATGKA